MKLFSSQTLWFLSGTLLLFPVFAYAQGFVPLTSLPGVSEVSSSDGIASFLNQLYRISIGAAAVLAVLQIIRAGLMYMTEESISEKKEARHLITMAILGLVLVLSPAIVFGVIDPRILNLDLDLSSIQPATGTGTGQQGTPGTGQGQPGGDDGPSGGDEEGDGGDGENGDAGAEEGDEDEEGDGDDENTPSEGTDDEGVTREECEAQGGTWSDEGSCVGGDTETVQAPQSLVISNGQIRLAALPYSYVFATYDTSGSITYQGNTFSCALVNVDDSSETASACQQRFCTAAVDPATGQPFSPKRCAQPLSVPGAGAWVSTNTRVLVSCQRAGTNGITATVPMAVCNTVDVSPQ